MKPHLAPARARLWRRCLAGTLLAAFFTGVSGGCLTSPRRDAAVGFNQHFIETVHGRDRHGNTPSDRPAPDFDDPTSVLEYVLSHAPYHAVVYPSERYYYYQFTLGSRHVSGNIRFADVESGQVSIGYFDSYYPSDLRVKFFRHGEDGVELRYDELRSTVVLSAGGVSRSFRLDRTALRAQPALALLPSEVFVSGILDESGYFFDLIYWPEDRSFYYVLSPEFQPPEKLWRGASKRIEIYFGERSRFCFIRNEHLDRLILVGVHAKNIEENNWYDGPFDQVPPRLPIRPMLEEAYPYVIHAGGIDMHGNFLEREGQRVAISPYIAYRSGPELEIELEQLVDPTLPDPRAWTRATFEYKKSWTPEAATAQPASAHNRVLSASWPANHWAMTSREWGVLHRRVDSLALPPNHALSASASELEGADHPTSDPQAP